MASTSASFDAIALDEPRDPATQLARVLPGEASAAPAAPGRTALILGGVLLQLTIP